MKILKVTEEQKIVLAEVQELINSNNVGMATMADMKKANVDKLFGIIREAYPEVEGYHIQYTPEAGEIKILCKKNS